MHPNGLIALMLQARVPLAEGEEGTKKPLMEADGTIIGKMDYVHMLLLTPAASRCQARVSSRDWAGRRFSLLSVRMGGIWWPGPLRFPMPRFIRSLRG